MSVTNYILADNQDLSCLGFMQLISQLGKQHMVTCASNKAELKRCLTAKTDSLVIFDFNLFDWDNPEEVSLMGSAFPQSKWLCVTEVLEEKFVHQLTHLLPDVNIELKTGSKEELTAAINATAQGKKHYCSEALDIMLGNRKRKLEVEDKRILQLTATEKEIVQLLAQGKTTKDIANERCLSYHTIITHRKNIFRKLEINTVHELTKYALKNGLVDLTEYYI